MALPGLSAGKSLRFALLPEGQDPDDIARTGGPAAVERVLAAARPLVDMLWAREVEAGPLDTPERRAALARRLLPDAAGPRPVASVRTANAKALELMLGWLEPVPVTKRAEGDRTVLLVQPGDTSYARARLRQAVDRETQWGALPRATLENLDFEILDAND